MEPGQRVPLIQSIFATLSENEMSWAMIDTVLDEFGGHPADDEDPIRALLGRIRSLRDDRLTALNAYLHPNAADPQASLPTAEDPGPWKPDTFRLFISHTTAHKQIATEIRDFMARTSVDCFVAHSTIEPTREWQDEIERALRTCHALVALLTPDFPGSRWCDQEIGICYGQGTLVVPVRMGIDPYGFIGKFQGLTFLQGPRFSTWTLADQLFALLAKHPLTHTWMTEPVFRRFVRSWSWDNTRAVFPLVTALPKEAWTEDRLRIAREAAKTNIQILDGVLADGRGTPVPEALDTHLRTLGLADDDRIPF
jgi:hypothetical protein